MKKCAEAKNAFFSFGRNLQGVDIVKLRHMLEWPWVLLDVTENNSVGHYHFLVIGLSDLFLCSLTILLA